MNRAACILAFLVTVSTLAIAAPTLSVSYVEGTAYQRTGSSWRALSIGDTVSADASIRLENRTSVQLKGLGADFYLTQQGTYSIRDLLAARQKMSLAGIGKVLASSLAHLLTGPAQNQNAALGARGTDESDSSDPQWVETSTQISIQQAKDNIKSGRYNEAVEKLTQALDEASPEELPEVHYYLAYSYSQSGDTPDAARQLAGVTPNGNAPWFGDYVLLRAKLSLDTFAFEQAIKWLTQPGNDLSDDAERASLYYFLLGMGYQGIGDTANQKRSFSKVMSISGESDLGKAAAAQLQQNP